MKKYIIIALLFSTAQSYSMSYIKNVISYTIGYTPEHFQQQLAAAASENYIPMIEHALNNGADINFQDAQGDTALHIATNNYNVESTDYLLKHGARTDSKNNEGNTPLHCALRSSLFGFRIHETNHKKNIVKMLLQHKAPVNSKNNQDQTPLERAIVLRDKNIVMWLLQHGANLSNKELLLSLELRLTLIAKLLADYQNLQAEIEKSLETNQSPRYNIFYHIILNGYSSLLEQYLKNAEYIHQEIVDRIDGFIELAKDTWQDTHNTIYKKIVKILLDYQALHSITGKLETLDVNPLPLELIDMIRYHAKQ
jgi:ankyrin repeat protein